MDGDDEVLSLQCGHMLLLLGGVKHQVGVVNKMSYDIRDC